VLLVALILCMMSASPRVFRNHPELWKYPLGVIFAFNLSPVIIRMIFPPARPHTGISTYFFFALFMPLLYLWSLSSARFDELNPLRIPDIRSAAPYFLAFFFGFLQLFLVYLAVIDVSGEWR